MFHRFSCTLVPLVLLSLSTAGCVVVEEDTPTGILTVEWSIGGELAARDCLLTQSDRLELVVIDDFDGVAYEVETLCEDFEISLELEEGLYFPEVTLVDSFDQATSDTLELDSVVVRENEELILEVNFRLSDFF